MYSDTITFALSYAAKLHQRQGRKGTEVPYLSHLMSVSALVMEYGGSEEQAIAALLHDAVEDQGGRSVLVQIEKFFGSAVARIVEDCSDSLAEDPGEKAPWRQRKEEYLAHLEDVSTSTLLVSCADKLHNLRSIIRDYDRMGEGLWQRFNASGPDAILWSYEALAEVYEQRLNNPISIAYRQAVNHLKENLEA